jgi:hypothetical protein
LLGQGEDGSWDTFLLVQLAPRFIAKLLRAKKKKKQTKSQAMFPKEKGSLDQAFPQKLGYTSTKMTFKQVEKPLKFYVKF